MYGDGEIGELWCGEGRERQHDGAKETCVVVKHKCGGHKENGGR